MSSPKESRLFYGNACKLIVRPGSGGWPHSTGARFERAAKTLASLNHPHIAQIHGFEQQGAPRRSSWNWLTARTPQRIARGLLPLFERVRDFVARLAVLLHMGDVRLDLDVARSERGSAAPEPGSALNSRWRTVMPWGAAAVMALVATFAVLRPAETPQAQVTQFDISPPPDDTFAGDVSLSPDGTRVAVHTHETGTANGELWLVELQRAEPTRLTTGTMHDDFPVWSPDGTRLAVSAGEIWIIPANGSRGSDTRERLVAENTARPTDWRARGDWIIYHSASLQTGADIWAVTRGGIRPEPPTFGAPDERVMRIPVRVVAGSLQPGQAEAF